MPSPEIASYKPTCRYGSPAAPLDYFPLADDSSRIRRFANASLSAVVFRALRESNLRLLESVPRARWVECYGVHEVRGRQTVEEFVRLEAAHDLNHLRQIDHILGG